MLMTAEALEKWARKHKGPLQNNAVVRSVFHSALQRAIDGRSFTYEEYMDFMVQHLIAAQADTAEQYSRHMKECTGGYLFRVTPVTKHEQGDL